MTTEQKTAKHDIKKAVVEQSPKPPRVRATDNGSEVLPHLEHFVRLTRKIQRPGLVSTLLEVSAGQAMPAVRALSDAAEGSLPLASRNSVFAAVAELNHAIHAVIERAAERVDLLCDEFGALAITDLLDMNDGDDAEILSEPTDKYSRALYLYLRQEHPGAGCAMEDRFDHAEVRQVMLQQALQERYSSHYLGPKGVMPKLDELAESALKQRLVVIFPTIKVEDILVERFERRDLSHPEKPVLLVTWSATFNGTQVHYQQVANGMVEDKEVPAASNVRFEWQSAKGTLGVYCEDHEVRPELAAVFRDVALGGNGDITSMPIREFDLMGFCTPAMLARFRKDRIEGIESMEIKTLVVCKPEVRQAFVRGRAIQRRVENALVIRRHRFEERDIYATAREVHGIDDLTGYVVQQVRLSMRIAKTPFRKAHNVSVQITAPNGFNDQSKTDQDANLIFAQLMRLDCARRY